MELDGMTKWKKKLQKNNLKHALETLLSRN